MIFSAYRIRRAVHQGQEQLRAGRWNEAERKFRDAMAKGDKDPATLDGLAIALLKQGRWEEAAETCRETLALDPEHIDATEHLGIALLKSESWEDAAGVYRRAVQVGATGAGTREQLGIALSKLHRWEEAARAYREAIEIDGNTLLAHFELGAALAHLDRWNEALEVYQRAAELAPDEARSHRALSAAHFQLGDWQQAAEACKMALSLDPDDSESAARLSSALAMLPPPESVGVAPPSAPEEEAVPQPGTPPPALQASDAPALLQTGIELLQSGHWTEAMGVLEKGVTLGAEETLFQFLLVDPLLRTGRGQEAIAAYRRALELGGALPTLTGEDTETWMEARGQSFWTSGNLREQVFQTERWLEELASAPSAEATTESDGAPRLLFVLDEDYGELTTLMYLVLGQPELLDRTTLLLPDRLYEKNSQALPGRTQLYGSVDDILETVERDQASIVFLCSGYLLGIHRIINLDELERLVGLLHERGCRVVTMDPFLGLLSSEDPSNLVEINIPESHVQQLLERKEIEQKRLLTNLTRSEKILSKLHHVYPAYCDLPEEAKTAADARNVAFFNPALIQGALDQPPATGAADRPHWLFILSKTDFEAQMLFEGTGFIDLVAERLIDAVIAGRHPIFFGPKEFVETLIKRIPTTEGIDILTFCPFNQLMSLALTAEYAFYWNFLSHSILIRLFNKKPVVVFDKGHLVRNVTTLYDRVVRWYYQGWEPPFTDHHESLTLEALAACRDAHQQEGDRLLERFKRAPEPRQAIEQLAGADPVVPD